MKITPSLKFKYGIKISSQTESNVYNFKKFTLHTIRAEKLNIFWQGVGAEWLKKAKQELISIIEIQEKEGLLKFTKSSTGEISVIHPENMKNSEIETIKHILSAYGFLIKNKESLSNMAFAQRIRETYSLSNPANNFFYEALVSYGYA